MMPARRVFPPFLLLLLAWTFPTRVHGQQVNASLVSTYYVEVTWVKTLLWLGVDDYNVNFTAESSNDCTKTIHCSDVICTFNSLPCGVVSPCTNTTTTVTGGEYSAPPLSLVTGPEKVTNFAVNLEEGVEHISWVNPSMNSSPCYEETAIRVSFNGEDSISYFNHTQESTSKGLCGEGYGQVEVWTQGGDGHSNSSWETIIYNGSEVVDVVTLETCEPVGCTSLYVEWSFAPVCPDVQYLSVEVGDVRQNASINTSDLIVTGLEVEEEYYTTCIYAMNKDGNPLHHSCNSYCDTPIQVPENFTVKPLSTSALHFTWDPTVCQKPGDHYELQIDYYYLTTTETECIVHGLRPFYEYYVTLQVGRGYHYSDKKATVTAYTLPNRPVLSVSWRGDQVYASWYFSDNYHWGFTFRFKVTWGKSLQHEEETINQYLWIEKFNSTDEVYQVCVAGYPIGREDLMSDTDCEYVSDSGDATTGSGLSGWAIALIVLGTLAVIAMGVFCAAVHHYKSKAQHRQLQEQQQRQQHDVNPYNYGVTNPAPIE